jgi:hypothetical protein
MKKMPTIGKSFKVKYQPIHKMLIVYYSDEMMANAQIESVLLNNDKQMTLLLEDLAKQVCLTFEIYKLISTDINNILYILKYRGQAAPYNII